MHETTTRSIAPAVRADAADDRITLCDALDRVLTKGVVVRGELTISVADVDLVYLGFNLLLASVETARSMVGGSGFTPAEEKS
jgi:hypothetical protein